jgi:hypothetical protein
MTRVFGSELKVGDTIKVWWSPNLDTIVALDPYKGPIAHLFKSGAAIAKFQKKNGMTIDLGDLYDRLN